MEHEQREQGVTGWRRLDGRKQGKLRETEMNLRSMTYNPRDNAKAAWSLKRRHNPLFNT